MRREIIFGVAGFGLALFIAGCTSAKPKVAEVQTPAPVVASATNPPPVAPAPLEVIRPRPPADASDNMAAHLLEWDAVEKEYHASVGETNAPFIFTVTNVSPEQVTIYDVSTTCECTIAQLPSKPWMLGPGSGGKIHATLDLHGRTSTVTNYVIIFTSKGNRLLTVKGFPSLP